MVISVKNDKIFPLTMYLTPQLRGFTFEFCNGSGD